MGPTLCAGCDAPLLLGKQDDPLCPKCVELVRSDQLHTYREAVRHVLCSPAGKFTFFQSQLEMVVEDLALVIKVRRLAA